MTAFGKDNAEFVQLRPHGVIPEACPWHDDLDLLAPETPASCGHQQGLRVFTHLTGTYPLNGRMSASWIASESALFVLACCQFRGHEDKSVTKELESGYDET